MSAGVLHRAESALFYACGYSCDNGLLIMLSGQPRWFITDGRYTTEAKEAGCQAEVIESSDLLKTARQLMRASGQHRWIIDPKEWTHGALKALQSKLPTFQFLFRSDHGPLQRAVKSPEEITLIREAVRENAEGFDRFARWLNENGEGCSEAQLHFQLEGFLRQSGDRDLSFNPILAINAAAAKPHALPGTTPLKRRDLLLLDAGTKYRRYCSDRTRTAEFGPNGLHFGLEQSFSDPKRQRIYDLVLKAHDRAIAYAKEGMRARELDQIARHVIDEAGYSAYFNHSLGHGVGLDIHEHPYINRRNEMILKEGMVFTIEPGIYLPGEFGVRIEDVVVIQGGRAEVL
jgi:Xaa-Pro aminopeptidase